jgi:hypothetical protein
VAIRSMACRTRVEIERCSIGLPLIGRRGYPDHVRRVLWSWFGVRRQPPKLRVRACDHHSDWIAIGPPSQAGGDADAKNYQETDDDDQGSLANRGPPVWIPVVFQVGRANSRQCVYGGLGLRGAWHGTTCTFVPITQQANDGRSGGVPQRQEGRPPAKAASVIRWSAQRGGGHCFASNVHAIAPAQPSPTHQRAPAPFER